MKAFGEFSCSGRSYFKVFRNDFSCSSFPSATESLETCMSSTIARLPFQLQAEAQTVVDLLLAQPTLIFKKHTTTKHMNIRKIYFCLLIDHRSLSFVKRGSNFNDCHPCTKEQEVWKTKVNFSGTLLLSSPFLISRFLYILGRVPELDLAQRLSTLISKNAFPKLPAEAKMIETSRNTSPPIWMFPKPSIRKINALTTVSFH